MRKKSKRKTVNDHFDRRCIERIGYIPDRRELVKSIQRNELEFVGKQSCRVTHWKWVEPVYKITCILPYDKERKQIITILFEDIYDYRYQGVKRKCGR